MELIPLLLAFVLFCLGALFVGLVLIVLVSRKLKGSGAPSSPIGHEGVVSSELSPYGAVLVNGVLWAAVDIDNAVIAKGERIEVLQTRESALAVRVLRKS